MRRKEKAGAGRKLIYDKIDLEAAREKQARERKLSSQPTQSVIDLLVEEDRIDTEFNNRSSVIVAVEQPQMDVIIDDKDEGMVLRATRIACGAVLNPMPLFPLHIPISFFVMLQLVLIALFAVFLYVPMSMVGAWMSAWCAWAGFVVSVWIVSFYLAQFILVKLINSSPHLGMEYYLRPLSFPLTILLFVAIVWPSSKSMLNFQESSSNALIDQVGLAILLVSFLRLVEQLLLRWFINTSERGALYALMLQLLEKEEWLRQLLGDDPEQDEISQQVAQGGAAAAMKVNDKMEKQKNGVVEGLVQTFQVVSSNFIRFTADADVLIGESNGSGAEKSIFLAHQIYRHLTHDDIGVENRALLPRDFLQEMKGRQLKACFRYFDRTNSGRVTLTDLENGVKEMFETRSKITNTLKDRRALATVLSNASGFIFWPAMLLVVMGVFGFGLEAFISMGTTALALTFVFGSSLQNVWLSFLWLFVIKPYDVGDRIKVNGEVITVSKLHLLHTEAYAPDGRLVYLRNSALYHDKMLEQRARSRDYVINFSIICEPVSDKKLAELKQAIQTWIAGCAHPFKDGIDLWLSYVQDHSVKVSFWMPLKDVRWNQPGLYLPAQSALMAQLPIILEDLGFSQVVFEKRVETNV